MIGYLFRVTEEKKVQRNVLFFMEVIDSEYLLPPESAREAHLLTGASDMRNFLNFLPKKVADTFKKKPKKKLICKK